MKLLTRYLQTPWALEEAFFQRMHQVFERKFAGEKLEPEAIAAIVEEGKKKRAAADEELRAAKAGMAPDDQDGDEQQDPNAAWMTEDGVAVVPVVGVIAPHASMVNGLSQPQGTDTGRIEADLAAFADERMCKGILVYADSPGGAVNGIEGVRAAVAAASAQKPVHCFTAGMMASAMYWIACACERMTGPRSCFAGSIGVFQVRDDTSKILEGRGVKRYVVRSVPNKGAGVDGTKITEGDLAKWQGEVDALHAIFAGDVARDRGLSPEQLAAVADGRIFTGEQSVELGLIDGTGTLGEAIEGVLMAAQSRNNPIAGPGRPSAGTSTRPGSRTTMTAAELREKYPQAVAEIEAAAVETHKKENPAPPKDDNPKAEEPASAEALAQAFGKKDGGKAFAFECLEKKMTLSAAHAAWSEKVEAENADLKKKADTAAKLPSANAANPLPFTPKDAAQPKAAGAEGGETPAHKTYEEAVVAVEKRDKVKRPVAMARAAREFSALHEDWRGRGKPAIK